VLALLTEEEVPGLGTPGWYLPGQRDVDLDLLHTGMDGVRVQVARERVVADPDVAGLGGSGERLGSQLHVLLYRGPVGQGQVDTDRRADRLVQIGHLLAQEDHDELRTIVQMRVEVPPLVRAPGAVGAHSVLPQLDRARFDA